MFETLTTEEKFSWSLLPVPNLSVVFTIIVVLELKMVVWELKVVVWESELVEKERKKFSLQKSKTSQQIIHLIFGNILKIKLR